MKRFLAAFIAAIMLAALCLTAADAAVYKDGSCTLNGYVYNLREKTAPTDYIKANPAAERVASAGKYIATGDTVYFSDGTSAAAVIYGDIDCNGIVDANDYLLAKRAYLETFTPKGAANEAAKEGDKMTPADYLRIKRHVLGTYDLYSFPHKATQNDANGVKIAYIPLDNRPVNKDRAEYLAAAAGFTLLIPDEDLYRTALDNMEPNKSGLTYGDRKALLAWLKSIENECDYYVISLDQMFSGGLVGSRWLSNTDLTLEYEIADYLIALSARKHVVLFDTVMRLASTVNYQGYTMEDYSALRTYGMKARKPLSGSSLNVENIIAGYRYDENGAEIPISISGTKLDEYLASRERKLRLIDRVLSIAGKDIAALYVGVDDSSPQITIQTNEINYIKKLAGENLYLFAGADELGLMGIAQITGALYGGTNCRVAYFGEGADSRADAYDTGTLRENVERHIEAIGGDLESSDPYALQVLVLTRTSDISGNAAKLIAQAEKNLDAGVPTCIIDASTQVGELQRRLLASKSQISRLLGYSNWNTVGNAVGIAISNAAARYCYIYRSKNVTKDSDNAFLKTLTFSLIKDISYRAKDIENLSAAGDFGPQTILARLNSGSILAGVNCLSGHGRITVSNLRKPWNRNFEATFDISIAN